MPTKTAEDYLAALADELAVSEARYDQACRSYASLGASPSTPNSTASSNMNLGSTFGVPSA